MSRHTVFGVTFLLLSAAFVATSLVTQAEEHWLRGVVLDPEGRALPGAEVSLRVPQGGCKFVVGAHIGGRDVAGTDGSFSLPTPPGDMEIYVRHPDYAPGWSLARNDAVIQLKAASWIEGEVSTPCTITISRGPWRYVRERIEGTFRCGPLPPDEVLSLILTSETHRPYSTRFVLGEGQTRTLGVSLKPGATLEGKVFPAHEGATIRAHGRDGREFTATTASDGTFTVTGLTEGWVRVVVLSPGLPLQVLDANTSETVEVRWPQ